MFCNQCGKKLSEEDFFCSNCGTRVPRRNEWVDEESTFDETVLYNPGETLKELEKLEKQNHAEESALARAARLEREAAEARKQSSRAVKRLSRRQQDHETKGYEDARRDMTESDVKDVEKGAALRSFKEMVEKVKPADVVQRFRQKKDADPEPDEAAIAFDETVEDSREDIGEEAGEGHYSGVYTGVVILGVVIGIILALFILKPWANHDDEDEAVPTTAAVMTVVAETPSYLDI